MRDGDLHDRVAALERHVAQDAERWRKVSERIDALRGAILGIVVALNEAHPEVGDTLIDALRRFEREARRLDVLDAAVSDTQELVDMIEAHRS